MDGKGILIENGVKQKVCFHQGKNVTARSPKKKKDKSLSSTKKKVMKNSQMTFSTAKKKRNESSLV
jgi:hypothetical protein